MLEAHVIFPFSLRKIKREKEIEERKTVVYRPNPFTFPGHA